MSKSARDLYGVMYRSSPRETLVNILKLTAETAHKPDVAWVEHRAVGGSEPCADGNVHTKGEFVGVTGNGWVKGVDTLDNDYFVVPAGHFHRAAAGLSGEVKAGHIEFFLGGKLSQMLRKQGYIKAERRFKVDVAVLVTGQVSGAFFINGQKIVVH